MIEEILKSLDKAVVTDVKVYDMRNKTPFYDYSIIASATSSRQAMAAITYLKDDANLYGLKVRGYSSSDESTWHLIDLGEVVVHIFVGEDRIRYNLDGIYSS